MSAHWVRVPSRTRWLCTAVRASRLGIGADGAWHPALPLGACPRGGRPHDGRRPSPGRGRLRGDRWAVEYRLGPEIEGAPKRRAFPSLHPSRPPSHPRPITSMLLTSLTESLAIVSCSRGSVGDAGFLLASA